jgi:hypothetical protein
MANVVRDPKVHPDACTSCHTDRSNAWATGTLKMWPEFSPRRVGAELKG